jgi:outer membrane protein TolC
MFPESGNSFALNISNSPMNMRSISLIVLLVFTGTATVANAQVYTLKDLLETSKKNYPLLKSKLADVDAVSHEVKFAAADYIPKISAQHQYTYGTDNSVAGSFYPNPTVISPSGGIRDQNIDRAVWGSYTSTLMEWNAINFGKVSGNVKSARANLENSKASYTNEVFQHQIRVTDSYLLKLISDKLVDVHRANLERALRFKQIVDAGVRSGLRPGVDSSLAHVEYIKAKLQLLDVERNKKMQTLRLFELTGTITSDEAVVDSMRFFNDLPVAADTASSRNNHPTLNFYKTQILLDQQRAVAIKRSFLPSITLVGAAWTRGSGIYNEDDSYHTDFQSGTKYRVNNYLLGLATRWVISDYAPIRQRYKIEKSRMTRDEEIYKEQDLRITRVLREAVLQFELALDQARMAPIQLTSARLAFDQANARYKSGLTDLPTLLQSMVVLNKAETDLAIANGNVWRSFLGISAAKGDLSSFLKAAGIQ